MKEFIPRPLSVSAQMLFWNISRSFFLSLFTCLLFVPVVRGDDNPNDINNNSANKIEFKHEMNEKRLNEFLNSGKNGMVAFFQPWCGDCIRMKPDWGQLAETVNNYDRNNDDNNNTAGIYSNVVIGNINCSNLKPICEEYGIHGYPTIIVYNNNNNNNNTSALPVENKKHHDHYDYYTGSRSYEDLIDYVDENLAHQCNITTFLLLQQKQQHAKNYENNNHHYCNDKEQNYLYKWNSKDEMDIHIEISRLQKMSTTTSTNTASITRNVKRWSKKRYILLQQLLQFQQQQKQKQSEKQQQQQPQPQQQRRRNLEQLSQEF